MSVAFRGMSHDDDELLRFWEYLNEEVTWLSMIFVNIIKATVHTTDDHLRSNHVSALRMFLTI